MKTKEFTKVAKQAKNEVKGVFSSPFVIINLLNKAAKGDFNKVANCEGLNRENIKQVASCLKKLHKGRYPFEKSILPHSADDRIMGYFTPIPAQQGELCALNCGEIVLCTDPRFIGRELCEREGVVGVFRPIPLTLNAVFGAFCAIVRADLKAKDEAEKQAAKQAKEAAKQAKILAKAKQVCKDCLGELCANFTENDYIRYYNRIKGAK